MPQLSRKYVWSIFCAALLCGGCSNANSAGVPARADTTGEKNSQSINLFDLDGKPVDLWRQPTHVTVAIFTRTDCPISNRAAPEICRLCEKYRPRDVDFYLIYVDPNQGAAEIRQHMKDFAYPCTALRDPEHSLVAYCHATATPEAVVFNQNRKITYQGRINNLYVDVGNSRAEPTTNDLDEAIEATVSGRPVANPRTRAVGCAIADLKN
jgi:hypothetical protein